MAVRSIFSARVICDSALVLRDVSRCMKDAGCSGVSFPQHPHLDVICADNDTLPVYLS